MFVVSHDLYFHGDDEVSFVVFLSFTIHDGSLYFVFIALYLVHNWGGYSILIGIYYWDEYIYVSDIFPAVIEFQKTNFYGNFII